MWRFGFYYNCSSTVCVMVTLQERKPENPCKREVPMEQQCDELNVRLPYGSNEATRWPKQVPTRKQQPNLH